MYQYARIHKLPNKLELAGRLVLQELNIEFKEQVRIKNKFLVDVFVEKYNLIIQWDGDYWHGHLSKLENGFPNKQQGPAMIRDKAQKIYFSKCGYNLLRFWEHEVHGEPDKVKETILDFISSYKY